LKNDLSTLKNLHDDFYVVKSLVYDKCGFEITDLCAEEESKEYGACHYKLNGKEIKFRVSKITPTKPGQFVTIWKRSINGITQPFDISDGIDFILITARTEDNFGLFIFSKSVLAYKGVITSNGKEGKRGIRVYAPWDKVTSKQAERTQFWQSKYFLRIKNNGTTDIGLAKKLFSI
jgi:hypothetical protein